MAVMAIERDKALPAFVGVIAPRSEAEATRNRREIAHIRALVAIKYGERQPLTTVGETIKRNAYRDHQAFSRAVLDFDAGGVAVDMTAEGMQ